MRTAAGEMRPAHRRRALHDGHRARAPARRERLPGRGRRRPRHAHLGRPRVRVPVRAGRATRRSRSRSATGSRSSTSSATAPGIERNELFPNRTNVSFWRRDRRRRDPRAHLRARRGGDDGVRAPAPRAPRWPPCCAGVDSPVTVAARRRRARGRRGRGPARRHDRLGAARVRRHAERGIPEGAECNRVADWTDCPRTCSPSSSGRSARRRPPAST